MIRIFKLAVLAFLWGLWLYFFIEATEFAYAFTHNISEAILPGSPIGLDFNGTVAWAESVAILNVTPFLLGILTWRSLRRDRNPTFGNGQNA